MPELPSRSLTIHLINPGLEHDSIISKIKSRNYRNFDIGNQRFHVFAKRQKTNMPSWESFFEGHLNKDFVWPIASPGVVVLTVVKERTFALTFGQGRHLLIADSWEDRFGLKVVLNTVEQVRSMDKNTFDAISGKTRTQAARMTDLEDLDQFGFDVEKDLLQAVTGKPDDTEAFGDRITGADALVVSARVDLAGLADLLGRYLHQSALTVYREKGFKFVDRMRAIFASRIKTALDAQLVAAFEERIAQLAVHKVQPDFPFDLIIPQVLDWEKTVNFGYGRNRARNPESHDLSIDTFLAYLGGKFRNRVFTVETLKKQDIVGLDGDGRESQSWRAFKCIFGEIALDGKRYVLSDGNWFEVDRDYLAELDAFISEIPPYPVDLPLYNGGTEFAYNSLVADTIDGFHNFDTKKLLHPQKGSPIEFCDLYTESQDFRDMIHVKHGTSSSMLSHLFSQGTTSAEVCTDFPKVQEEADKYVKTAIGANAYDAPNRPTERRVVYGIIRSRKGNLPFFSKVNLKRACRDLNRARIKYALAEIEYAPGYRHGQ